MIHRDPVSDRVRQRDEEQRRNDREGGIWLREDYFQRKCLLKCVSERGVFVRYPRAEESHSYHTEACRNGGTAWTPKSR